MMGEQRTFPMNIEIGDLVMIRARVGLTNKFRKPDPGVAVDFGDGHLIDVPLDAVFGIVTDLNGRKP